MSRFSFNETLVVLISNAESEAQVSLLAGLGAACIAGAFAYLHMRLLSEWPDVALDGTGMMIAYFTAGTAFQFGTPLLCLVTFIFGGRARGLWRARVGLAFAVVSLLAYTLYVRSCLEMMQ